MNVLSLFDGMSCGQIALHRAGIEVNQYYASEIDNNSIKIALKNYPKTIQLGDVRNLNGIDVKIDLLIGGSPCRNLSQSIQGKTKNHVNIEQGLKGESALFFEYVRVKDQLNPDYFLFENVESMNEVDKDIISNFLGVEPIMIDSSYFSAQNRKRYYWTNIPVELPTEKNQLVIKDILLNEEVVEEKHWLNYPYTLLGDDKSVVAMLDIKGFDLKRRVSNINFKCPTLTSCRGGGLQKKVFQNKKLRRLTPTEYERLQTVPDGYTEGVADSHRYNMLGDGWTVDVIAYIFRGLRNNTRRELEDK